jgi:WD40 repeat protein
LWDVTGGDKLHEWHFNVEARALAFSSDGRHLAVGNSDGTIYLLRLESARIKVK